MTEEPAVRTASVRTAAAEDDRPRSGRVSHGAGFWVVAGAFMVSTAFTVVTTPLWSIYERMDGFNTFMVTVAFSSYAVGVLVSLFLVGHVSDWKGRRTVMIPGVLLEALAAVLFLVWNDLTGLILARVITGLGLGMITATATAHIFDLQARARPGQDSSRPDIVATASNIGGFGVGVLVTSALVQWIPAPTVTPFIVFLILLLLSALGVALVPETVKSPAEPHPYRPQRVQVPPAARTRYFAAAAFAFAAFAVLGLFTSLIPTFVEGQLHIAAPMVSGVVIFVTFVSAATLQVGVQKLSSRAAVITGGVLYVTGFALLALGVALSSLGLVLLGGVLAGGAVGVLFSTALGAAGEAAPAESRGEAVAGIFLAAYIGLAVPVVGLGAGTALVSMATALTGFGAIMSVIAVISAAVFLRRAPRD